MSDTPKQGLFSLMRSDVVAARRLFGGSIIGRLYPNIYVAHSYRISHWLANHKLGFLGYILQAICQTLTGAEIRPSARLGPGLRIVHSNGVVVGGGVVAGRNLSLWGTNTLGFNAITPDGKTGGSPVFGDDCVVLTHASVLGPIELGNRVLVAAYALVIHDMPDGARPRGIPARWEPETADS